MTPARPTVHSTAFVHPTAVIVGDVHICEEASVWPLAVIRADVAPVHIGAQSNVQDGAVLHADPGGEARLGARVTVGHRAIVHGATVGDDTIVGMGAVVLEGARVGAGCIIAAGAVVPERARIPDGALAAGIPAAVKRVDAGLRERARANALRYVALAKRYVAGELASHTPR